MPRAEEAIGVREKLLEYSLNVTHESGGPKARGFERILGISVADVDYLELGIRAGIRTEPIVSVRNGTFGGVNCLVEMSLRGIGEKSERITIVRTAWEFASAKAPPRLITAYPRPQTGGK